MRCFAEANGGLTVVGDPDQSIYGWRSAEVENLNKMVKGKLICLSVQANVQISREQRQSTWKRITDPQVLSSLLLILSSRKVS